jgi:hypothetical protein
MKYVFIKKFGTGETSVSIVEDPIALYKSGELKEENGDQLFQLGNEVKIEMNIKVKGAAVYRSGEANRTIFDGPPGTLMNDDLGVGDYRG